jgi:hypothetical protein
MRAWIGLVLGCAVLAFAGGAHASLTLLTGPSVGTHAGNLVTNGSFETGAPAPGAGNFVYWASGTSSLPFGVPPGWSSQGTAANYAVWGSDNVTSPYATEFSDTLPDGSAGLYFGNGTGVFPSVQPTFNPNGTVTFASAPTFFPKPTYSLPVSLTQTVSTNLTPAPSYVLSFWVSGEDTGPAPPTPFNGDGIFGLRVSNVLPGNPIQYLTAPSGISPLGKSIRYEFAFSPLNSSLPVKVEFINWGHFDLSPYGGPNLTTELVLDDVIVNAVPEPGVLGLCLLIPLTRSRRRS